MEQHKLPIGRGAAALEQFLKNKDKGDCLQSVKGSSHFTHAVPQTRGRGAAALEILQRKKEELERVGSSTESGQENPKARGRAAMLEKYYKQKAVGASPEPHSAQIKTISDKIIEVSISDQKQEKVEYRGTSGKPLNLSTNYIKVNIEEGRGVFEYEVKFHPEVDAKNHRIELVNKVIGNLKTVRIFDGGHCLYLPQKLIETQKTFEMVISSTNLKVNVTIIFKKQKKLGDSACLHLYNILFKKIMHVLLYTQIGKNYFNTAHKRLIPQHKLEVYPGFLISVDERKGNLMLCLDTQHKVVHNQSAYELLSEVKSMCGTKNFKEHAAKALLGMVVITQYNHKTYIVHDILWDMTPKDTFPTSDGRSISFIEYYKVQYNLQINDLNQPLLLHRKLINLPGSLKKQDRMICLVPELCNLTALTDAMRGDFKLMKDVAQCTRVTPQQRLIALRTYIDNVRNSEKAQNILAEWGLSIADDNMGLSGRQLNTETIIFGDKKLKSAGPNVDWNREIANNQVLMPVDIRNWVIFYTNQDSNSARDFAEQMQRLSKSMGCLIGAPKLEKLPNDQTQTYVTFVRDKINAQTQVAVFICPTMRTDRYCVIKKLCSTQLGVASQVINSRTLSRPDKLRSIILKIALQINCKLGGSLWTVNFPFRGWMVCGIDVYHDINDKSVCGFVSNLNENFTKWFSMAIFQTKELSDFYQIAFTKALEEYKANCAAYPSKIIIIRDGVGDGQLTHCRDHEIRQFENVLKSFQFEIKICFIVVQKRINTRLFDATKQCDNPPPGTVVDHTITRKYLYDFFMVSQHVRQATVNPVHYIVLHDTCKLEPDHVQRLCYKLCHLYYNWPGTIKVPAPCQYAHKLAGMVGQFVKSQPCAELANNLWYL